MTPTQTREEELEALTPDDVKAALTTPPDHPALRRLYEQMQHADEHATNYSRMHNRHNRT